MAENKIQIDGVDYDIEKLPLDLRNTIAARQEIQQNKIRHEIELEKIDVMVLLKHHLPQV